MESSFDNILLATDSQAASLDAIQRTCDLAIKFESDITALFVAGTEEKGFEDSIKFIQGYTSSRGIKLEIINKKGNLYTETIKQLKQENFSLVVLGTNEDSVRVKWGRSEVFRVVKNSNCPVISYCGRTEITSLKEIVLPISEASNTRQKVPYCAELAKAFGSTVHIYGISRKDSKDTQKTIGSYLRQTERYLSERGIKYSVDSSYGVKEPRAIIAYSKQVRAGLVVTMTDIDSTGIFRKSYTEKLVYQCDIPIMWVHSNDTRLAGASGY
jgi:nucleotide-binding universal stress UspA family protein